MMLIRQPLISKQSLLLIGFILLKFIIQYQLISPQYDLHRDEYLHLDQANHLDWGYTSIPPLTSLFSWIIKWLGNTLFWVKFFPALFGSLTLLVVWKAIQALNGNLFALTLGAVSVLFSILLRLNTLYQPNSLDVLCWTTLYYMLLKCIQTRQLKWFLGAGFVFALGFLNKYNICFLLAGFLPAILLTRQRELLLTQKTLAACVTGVLLILPNLLWQYQHEFPVVSHMKELAESQLVHVDRLGFLKNQFLFFVGSFFVIIAGLYALMFYPHFEQYRAFLWSFFLTLLIFLYFRAKDYYAIGLYPIYLSFGSVFIAERLNTGRKRYLGLVCIAFPIAVFVMLLQFAFPNKNPEYILKHSAIYKKSGMLRWEDGKDHALPQDYADMLGWKELAAKADRLYANLADPTHTLVLCDNYGQAGAINYYTKQGIRAVSFNADYLNWFDLTKTYVNLIRVKTNEGQSSELEETSPYFQKAYIGDILTNSQAREYGTTLFVFTGAKIDIRQRIKSEINQRKKFH